MTPVHTLKENYGIEMALVVLCCRVHFNTAELETLEAYCNQNRVDWEKVMYLTAYHRIEPIVFKVLNHVKNIPGATTALIKQKQLFLIQQNFKQALETERIIQRLNDQGIECYPYKGVAFSKQFYGDITSRESSDIDLVAPEKDFEKILELLKQDGYSFENRVEYDFFENDIYKREKSLEFNKYLEGKRESHIEFHWRISTNTLQIAKEANRLLFQTENKGRFVRNEVKLINREAHYLAVFIHHAFNDAFCVLRNLVDLLQITTLKQQDIDTSFIQRSILQFRLLKSLQITQFLCRELIGAQIDFLETPLHQIGRKTKQHFLNRLLSKKMIGDYTKIRPFNKTVFYLKENPNEKIKYVIACLKQRFSPSPKDLRMFKIPKRFYFLYAILKPFRSLLFRVSDEEKKRIAKDAV